MRREREQEREEEREEGECKGPGFWGLAAVPWGRVSASQPGARQPPVPDRAVPPGQGWRRAELFSAALLEPAEVLLRISAGVRSRP